ncbi:DL-endopeptidase inhibitor IseA family protein [Paenibacillus sp. NPDC058071]|uniref:DL-endopeptidase inhibitor IseA family protein n=1 Tax=Paenibacillus sp. NPDC058071 TaxID=3346326 RepID=UPI0036DD5859
MAVFKETPLPRLRTFINQAERLWFQVYDSANTSQIRTVNGDNYMRLPLRFSTRSKVIDYFERYWNARISGNMFCNLHIITNNGRLYVPEGDPGPVPLAVVSLLVKNESSQSLLIRASLSGDPDGNYIVYYRISKLPGGNLVITNRAALYTDYRYMPCK